MRFPYLIILIVFCSCFLPGPATGQTADSVKNQQAGNRFILPPLSVLLDSALKHNALVRFRELEIDAKTSNLKSYKNYWARNFGIQADTRYGTFDNFSTNTSEGQSPSAYATTSSQFNYGVGAYVKFPIYDLINRKNQVNQATTELDMARSMAESQKDELRQLVIRLYNDLLMKQKLLSIKSQNMADSRINKEMVDNEFKNGVIPISEYVRISEIVARTESDYESAKSDFTTAYMILEEVVGFRINIAKP